MEIRRIIYRRVGVGVLYNHSIGRALESKKKKLGAFSMRPISEHKKSQLQLAF